MKAHPDRLQRLLLLAIAVFAAVYTLILLFDDPVSINLDGAMYLDGATRLMEGGLPYIDFVDINPPLAYYLHIPPALLADWLSIPPTNAFLLLIVAATLLSCAVTYRLLINQPNCKRGRAALVALTPALLLITLEPNFDLGQRSHLLMLAVLPWLTLRLQRSTGSTHPFSTAIIIGLFAGLTVCLKPVHYAAVLASIELFLLWKYRQFKTALAPEVIASLTVAAAYGASFLFMNDASHSAFFDLYLPLILESYDAYAMPTVQLFHKAGEYLIEPLILAIGCAALVRHNSDRIYRDLAQLGAVIAVISSLIFLLQGKGWAYHAIPVWFGAYLAVTCFISSLAKHNRFSQIVYRSPLLLLLALSLLLTGYATKEAAGDGKKKSRDYVSDVIRKYSIAGDTIYIMSPSVDAAYPLVLQVNRRQATRFPFLFPLPMLYDGSEFDADSPYRNRIAPERVEMEQDFLRTLNTDLTNASPPLLLIERWTPCLFCPAEMSLTAYIRAHADELTVLGSYTHTGWTKRHEIWLRNDVLDSKGPPE